MKYSGSGLFFEGSQRNIAPSLEPGGSWVLGDQNESEKKFAVPQKTKRGQQKEDHIKSAGLATQSSAQAKRGKKRKIAIPCQTNGL